MKTNFTLHFFKKFTVVFGLALLLGFVQSCTVVESVSTIENNRTRLTKKEREVKIYPDIIKRTMHIKNAENSEVDFFVFDTDGTLMIHYKMNEKDHKRINRLEKGIYTYQVFKKDEMNEAGRIIIK